MLSWSSRYLGLIRQKAQRSLGVFVMMNGIHVQIEKKLEKCNNSIYTFYKPLEGQRTLEVIFFHDIQQRESDKLHWQTWMSRSKPSVCWPTDWLSEKFPEARISFASYDGAIRKTNTSGRMDLYLIAENLWQDILQIYNENCPVFLVGHGLGGIIIKRIVQAMQDKLGNLRKGPDFEKLPRFLENVEGVFFYDTPFLGIERYKTTFFCGKSPLVGNLKTLNSEIARLNEWFRDWRTSPSRTSVCRTAALFASCRAPCATKGSWYTTTEASVRNDIDDFYTASDSDHSNVCQPRDQKCSRYEKLVGFLKMPRLPRNSGPDSTVEDSSEIESRTVNILREVGKVREGEGLYISKKDLENIKRFPKKWNRVVERFRECRLEKTDESFECELWTRLHDEPML